NGDLPGHLFLRLVARLTLEALNATAECGDRAFAFLVGAQRGDEGQASTALLRPRARRFWRRRGPCRAWATPGARSFLVLWLECGTRTYRPRQRVIAKALFRLLLGFELPFELLLAPFLLIRLARLSGVAIAAFGA